MPVVTSALQVSSNVMEKRIVMMGQMNTIAKSTVSGVNGVTGAPVLPHVVEDHSQLRGQKSNRQLVGEISAGEIHKKTKVVETPNAQFVSLFVTLF